MKRNFLTGLAILLPIALTLWILGLLIDFLTHPFIGSVENLISVDLGSFSQTTRGLLLFGSKMLILFILAAFILTVGYFGQLFFFRSLFHYGDLLLHRIPFVNKIYKATQDVVKTLFQEETTTFSQVVLVPFPHEKARSIGFITKRDQAAYMDEQHGHKVSVFVPGTPNPTMGFMLLYDRNTLIFTELSIEEALKFVISCGVMADPFKKP